MLGNCSECGGQVSDTATVCPHCGAPPLRKHSRLSRILGLDFVQPKPLLALRWSAMATWGGWPLFSR
jgi:predicted amidophosphoribosyltransferase